jgi:drug/metabolite transporter (DMT)-like permease
MHFLLLCMLSSTGIFIVFKFIDHLHIPSFPVIVINYLVATLLGLMISTGHPGIRETGRMEWLPAGMLIGILFIALFFLVASSSGRAGISITTVAGKMSVIFPITFSLLIDHSDRFTFLKALAILFTLTGVAMTVYRPFSRLTDRSAVYIPLLLFVGMGVVDSLVKYAQYRFVGDGETALFSTVLFLNAFLAGFIILMSHPRKLEAFRSPGVWVWGVLLGVVNFGSVFFLIRTLNYRSAAGIGMDSSVIFGVNNIGIVILSVLAGLWIFREHLRPLNWLGIFVSLLALIFFALG